MNERNRQFSPPKGHGVKGPGLPPRAAGKRARRDGAQPQPEAAPRACDHPGCALPGDYRAPKSRTALTDYYWFCLDHVRAYNAAWNFYAGMNADEIESFLRNDVTWERPTWPLGQRGSGFRVDASRVRDSFGVFNEAFGDTVAERPPLNSGELSAMREMNLSFPLTLEVLRARYKELCKQHHPDANGGDKEAEERFKRIGQAYKTLMESLQ
jgi:hypothetical protein